MEDSAIRLTEGDDFWPKAGAEGDNEGDDHVKGLGGDDTIEGGDGDGHPRRRDGR